MQSLRNADNVRAESMTKKQVKVDYHTQDVFFATDRKLSKMPEANEVYLDRTFGNEQVGDLTYGKALVSIPKVSVIHMNAPFCAGQESAAIKFWSIKLPVIVTFSRLFCLPCGSRVKNPDERQETEGSHSNSRERSTTAWPCAYWDA